MTHLTVQYPSICMGTNMNFHVLLPKVRPGVFENEYVPPSKDFPVLYLLHGAFDDGFTWIKRTNICELVDTYGIAVVLPDAGNSFYINAEHGYPFFSYLTEELYEYVQEILPVTKDPKKTFIGGCSMGGYGSLNAVLKTTNKYSKAVLFSSAVSLRASAIFVNGFNGHMPTELCDRKAVKTSDFNPLYVLEQESFICDPKDISLYLTCGDKDFTRSDNEKLVSLLREKGFDLVDLLDEGDHLWGYWDAHLEDALKWLLDK